MKSDEFNAASLDTGTWTTEDPQGGTTFSVTGTQLSMAFASGTSNRDMYTTGCNGSRVVQFVNDPRIFSIILEMDTAISSQYQITGLAFWSSTTNFLRADNYYSGGRQYYFAQETVGGSETVYANAASAITSTPGYLRVTRNESTWTFSESNDGSSWTQQFSGTVTLAGPLIKWGIVAGAGAPGGTFPALTGLYDWVHVSQAGPDRYQVTQQALSRSAVW